MMAKQQILNENKNLSLFLVEVKASTKIILNREQDSERESLISGKVQGIPL